MRYHKVQRTNYLLTAAVCSARCKHIMVLCLMGLFHLTNAPHLQIQELFHQGDKWPLATQHSVREIMS